MLEKFELGNFKAFGDIQSIDLKPLTLIFGANSAGKSTILQSLIYLSEAFKQRNWDIFSTRQGGEFIDFGGLQNIVHQKDVNNIVHFGLTVSGFIIVTPAEFLNNDAQELNGVIDSLQDEARRKKEKVEQKNLIKHHVPHYECTFTVRFGIKPDSKEIEYFSINEEEADLITYSNEQVEKVKVEADGEVLSITRNNEESDFDVTSLKPFSRFFLKRYLFEQGSKDEIRDFLDPKINKKTSEKELIEQIKQAGIEHDDDQFIAFWVGGIEDDIQLSPILRLIENELNDLNAFFGFDENIDNALYPIKNQSSIYEYVSEISHLGFFRPVPDRLIYKSANHKRDAVNTNDNIWETLLVDDFLRNRVNYYLSDLNKLDIGYKLEVQTWENQLESTQVVRRFIALEIRDLHNDTVVNLRELGQGVIQTIPILAALFDDSHSLISIEQPELHLHPGLQSRIGKMFADIAKEKSPGKPLEILKEVPFKQLLIETHSEHIVKAIQLEVAKQNGLAPEKVNILYVMRDHEKPQSIVKKLSLDENGSFTEPWPDDFFECSSDLTYERLKLSNKN